MNKALEKYIRDHGYTEKSEYNAKSFYKTNTKTS
jgi:hypothetical protein